MNSNLVRALFNYDYENGLLIHKHRHESLFAKPQYAKSWNTKYAGKPVTTIDGKGYVQVSIKGNFYRAHRLIWLYVYDEEPLFIDHINGIRTDNRIENLRSVTCQQNHLNTKINSKNTSGVTGVYRNKKSERWCAQMKFNGRIYHLGSSKSFFDAVCLRKSEENKLGFSERHGEPNVT